MEGDNGVPSLDPYSLTPVTPKPKHGCPGVQHDRLESRWGGSNPLTFLADRQHNSASESIGRALPRKHRRRQGGFVLQTIHLPSP